MIEFIEPDTIVPADSLSGSASLETVTEKEV
jgi:hypothetical protein